LRSFSKLKFLEFKGGAPGLDLETDPVDMESTFTPSAYGLNIDVENRLGAGTIPTGTARVNKTFTVNEKVYDWHYQRLWLASSNSLIYGAPYYTDKYYKQGIGQIDFDEDATVIVEIIPFGGDSLAIGKSTGSYMLGNLSDIRGEPFWTRSDIMQEIKLSAAANATELDGVAYFSTTDGLFSFQSNGEVKEITRRVRNTLGSFSDVAILPDYKNKRIIGTDKFVYDIEKDRLYDFGTSGFLYTSPVLHDQLFSPILVDKVYFITENTGGDDGEIDVQYKLDENDWSDSETLDVIADTGQHSHVVFIPEERVQCRRFQFRIRRMESNVRIRAVHVDISGATFDHYSQ